MAAKPDETVGLCATCRHARPVPAPRATYWLCARAATDARFVKYPRLPMLECPGYERGAAEERRGEPGR